MAGTYSKQALLTYLRDAALSGRLHPAVARSRHKAAEALFEYVSDDEGADLRRLDLKALSARLVELPRGDLRPEIVELYIERIGDAVDEYVAATGGIEAEPLESATPAVTGDRVSAVLEDRAALEAVHLSFNRYREDVVPVPLGKDRVVYLHGVPSDLSAAEARKIARVVEALGVSEDIDR